MRIGLFIPCYIDQLYPNVGRATVAVLERLGHEIGFPEAQTCCGQPMCNSGYARMATGLVDAFAAQFRAYERVIAPSASCILHLKENLETQSQPLAHRIFELSEFLHDEVPEADWARLDARFPHRVGLHASCHGLRGLGLGSPSECMIPGFSKPARLLRGVAGLELVELDRADECCGFGGTFSVLEADVSAAMGRDRVADHTRHGAEYITSVDMSCLMHLGGLVERGTGRPRIIHLAEILASSLL